jgi:tellurite resistance protein TerC
MAAKMLPVDAIPIYVLLVIIAGVLVASLSALFIEARRQKALISPDMIYEWGEWAGWTYRGVRRLVILAVGSTVILIGFIMIVLPGPATLIIPLGLAILATEFAWARRLLRRAALIARMARKKLRR